MANLIPRNFWDFPSLRMPSLLDDIDNIVAFPQAETGSVSVSEDDKNVYIEAAVPGVDPDDVEVTFDRGMVWIRGEAGREEKDEKRKFYRRAARSFSYRIAVPGEIDARAEPQASYENGMLMLLFPKSAQSRPKKITVKRNKDNGKGQRA